MSDVGAAAVLDARRTVEDPDLKRDLVSRNMIEALAAQDGRVSFTLVLTTAACPLKDQIEGDCRAAVERVPGVRAVEIKTISRVRKAKHPAADRKVLEGVAQGMAIGSGKGGVGTSTLAAN